VEDETYRGLVRVMDVMRMGCHFTWRKKRRELEGVLRTVLGILMGVGTCVIGGGSIVRIC